MMLFPECCVTMARYNPWQSHAMLTAASAEASVPDLFTMPEEDPWL